jgi:prepilin-type N-terminal cleavage/methylation domain-containing protein
MNTDNNSQQGFTIVEMIITIIVSSLFIMMFFQMYLVLESQRVQVARVAKAHDIAYSNLRKFTTRPASLTCDSSMDLIANGNATGKLLGDQSNSSTSTSSTYGFVAEPTAVTQSLGANSTQTVYAFAPSGCGSFDDQPIKIVSTVTFGSGSNENEVTHASFVR